MKLMRASLGGMIMAAATAGCGGAGPCAVTLRADAAHDLVAVGAGECATTVALDLRVATGDPAAPSWARAGEGALRVEGAWAAAGAGVVARTVVVTNPTTAPVALVGLEWSTEEGTLAGDRLLHNGYQSWSSTGFEPIPSRLEATAGTAPRGGDNEDVLGELAGVSWWWSAVTDEGGRGVVVGADGATVLKTRVAVDGVPRARLRIVAGVTGDALVLAPGESRAIDGIVVGLGDVAARLEDYAARVAALHPRHPTGAGAAALGGWGSWNLYYAAPTAAAMREEAAWVKATLAPLGLTDFLLDDGYEPRWGVWEAAPAFGATLDGLNGELAAAGLRPALWLAPFYVAVEDPLVAAHPDWFVHRSDGTLRTYNNIGPSYAALDVTHPEARASVVEAVRRLRAWGYRTLKIDFLFGGAIEGVRQRAVTGLESYQLWMEALREAAPDLHLVGCGAPLLASVGWVDSMRTGPDIAFVTLPAPRFGFLAAQARQTAYRGFTDRFWALDPDVVLLRGDVIDDGEAWTHVVSAAMAGGNWLLGDGRQASAARLAMVLAPSVRELARDGRAARPVDLVAETADLVPTPLLEPDSGPRAPHLWRKQSADGTRRWTALFAWDAPTVSAQVALRPGAVELVPPSSAGGAVTEVPVGALDTADVAAHRARLFRD